MKNYPPISACYSLSTCTQMVAELDIPFMAVSWQPPQGEATVLCQGQDGETQQLKSLTHDFLSTASPFRYLNWRVAVRKHCSFWTMWCNHQMQFNISLRNSPHQLYLHLDDHYWHHHHYRNTLLLTAKPFWKDSDQVLALKQTI